LWIDVQNQFPIYQGILERNAGVFVVREVESVELVVVVMSVQLMRVSMQKCDGNRKELGTADDPNEPATARTKNTL